MTPLTIIAARLGFSVAKALAKVLLKDRGDFLTELVPDVIGQVGEGAQAGLDRDAEKKLAMVGEEIARRIQPFFEVETAHLDQYQRATIVRELALTLAAAKINADLLVRCRLDPTQFATHLFEVRPGVTRDLSTDEEQLYRRMLNEAAREITALAADLTGFEGSVAATQLQTDGQILEYLANLLQQPAQADVAFEEDYRYVVQDAFDHPEVFGIRRMDQTTGRQSLSIAYITLEIDRQDDNSSRANQAIPDKDQFLSQLLQDESIDLVVPEGSSSSQPSPVDHLLPTIRQLVVRGDAGSGKTTLMQWIAVRAARRDFPPILAAWNNTVTFLIRLRDRVGKGFPTPEELPGPIAKNIIGAMPQGWVHRILKNGRAVVLIDGLDELPDDQRQPMLDEFDRFIHEYPYVRYVITSRSTTLKAERWPEWPEWLKRSGFIETVLRPMSQPKIEQFVERWYAAFASTLSEARELTDLEDAPQHLIQLLERRPHLRQTASSPLLCAMICALHQERRQNLPSERIKLYQDCIDMLLGRRDEGRKINLGTTYPNLTDTQKLTLIQNFAYSMMQNGDSEVSRVWADTHFGERIALMRVPEGTTGKQICDFFIVRAALLREPVDGYIDFAHRTFQEFLAAQAAARNHDTGFLRNNAHNDLWRETIVLAAGLLSQAECEQLLTRLIAPRSAAQRAGKHPSTATAAARRYQSVALAVACLETAVELSPQIRDQIVEAAATLFPPKDVDEARLLATGGDAVVPLLYHKPEYTEQQAGACIQALAIIGTPAALDAIISYADDERPQVSQRLVVAWTSFNRREYAVRVLRRRSKISVRSLDSWEGFDQLTNLTSLDITSLIVRDISPLAQLTSLTSLVLRSPRVQDLNPLVQLTNLTSLILNCPRMQDLSPLAQLTSLTSLSLNSLMARDPRSAVQFANLFSSSTALRLQDLSPLAQLTNLTSLTLSGLEVQDLSPLARLTDLTSLNLGNTKVQDLSPLAQLTRLTSLSLCASIVRNGRLLPKRNRFPLKLVSRDVQDLSSLAQLTNLTLLDLSGTNVQDLSPLAQLTSLTSLDLSGTNVQDLSPLAQLTSLTSLDLNDTNVQDFSPLAQLTSLTWLRLMNTSIQELHPLVALTNLQYLDIEGTQVNDLVLLTGLTHLKHLDITRTTLHGMKVLEHLPDLEIQRGVH